MSSTIITENRQALDRAEHLAREHAARESRRRKRRRIQLGSVVAVAVAILAALAAVSSSIGGSPTAPIGRSLTAAQVHALLAGIPQHGVTLGRDDAPVIVAEFADLQCPFCRAYTMSESPAIVSKYVRAGEVKLVFRNLTFIGPDSTLAARAAAAAALQNKLWDFADVFYARQREENSGYVTDAFLARVGAEVDGLSVNKMMSERGSAAVAAQLADARTLARAHSVTATPTFIVQRAGRRPVKVVGAASLQAAIDRALRS